ncbi:hypothetical protein DFQ28_000651 [Apophysomyces sp. BC1034]|nr:hypothetical protein DFQ30_000675 [Apophysomyces sp. BC1015]KAG0178238.1 hypothetical protein DFQ29_003764 [Apophysomyces sp. BC1021]KAG0191256.1 hypothetical protein DFQ28_000651 [Apophysomyces sp. BC1034]
MNKNKRRSESPLEQPTKRARPNLLNELTDVLAEIKSTPSSGEISAELLKSFKGLMLRIERMSADESNTEAKQMKHESDLCLESWFDDLVAQCEADGELDWEDMALPSDDEDSLAVALALQEVDSEDDDEEEIDIEHVDECTIQVAIQP